MFRTVSTLAAAFALTGAALGQQTTPAVPLVPAGQTGAKTTQPKQPIYDEQADAKEQIAAALKKAKADDMRVLIQWGGNWCGWCTLLHDLCQTDTEIRATLGNEYKVIHIDAGGREAKNMDLAKGYGADLAKHGFPFLTILDSSGKVLINHETSSLENKDQQAAKGHDPAAVLALLKKYQAPQPGASSILDAGLSQARASGKTVFLHFGAPWCGWCHRLEDWMAREDIKPILAKQFVDVKLDIERNEGAKEILANYRGPKESGIPWLAFLDDTGKSLADSTYADGEKSKNTGFPYEPAEVAHFEKMLRKTPGKFSDADIRKLIDSLNRIREEAEKKKGQ